MSSSDTVSSTRGTASGSATATPGPRRSRRRLPEFELVTVALEVSGQGFPADTFAPASLLDGHDRGAAATIAMLRQAKAQLGTEREHQALLLLRDYIAHAGAARLVPYQPQASADSNRKPASRCWAGFEAMRIVLSLVAVALQRVDLDRLEAHAKDRAAENRKLAAEFGPTPEDADAGRARAAAQRARRTGGAA